MITSQSHPWPPTKTSSTASCCAHSHLDRYSYMATGCTKLERIEDAATSHTVKPRFAASTARRIDKSSTYVSRTIMLTYPSDLKCTVTVHHFSEHFCSMITSITTATGTVQGNLETKLHQTRCRRQNHPRKDSSPLIPHSYHMRSMPQSQRVVGSQSLKLQRA